MKYIKISILLTKEAIEPVSERLFDRGITGVEVDDGEDFLRFLEDNHASWDYVDDELLKEKSGKTRIHVYVSDNEAGHTQMNEIITVLTEIKQDDIEGKFGSLEVKTQEIDEEDWANNWKKYYKPIFVGEKIIICPEWEETPKDTGRIVFTINPGMSFGTGSHETTRLCIEELEKHIKSGDKIADLGCGSGILSVIACLLGAEEGVAVDIDPNAAEVAEYNASRNGIDNSKYKTFAGNILTDTELQQKVCSIKYNVVVANIVADVIIKLAPIARELICDSGVFIASGIILDRLEEVEEAVTGSGFTIMNVRQDGEWAVIVSR